MLSYLVILHKYSYGTSFEKPNKLSMLRLNPSLQCQFTDRRGIPSVISWKPMMDGISRGSSGTYRLLVGHVTPCSSVVEWCSEGQRQQQQQEIRKQSMPEQRNDKDEK
jgi:hypothetical protein